MVRTQIQLREEQARKLRALAREQGVSLAEVIRRCLDDSLADSAGDRSQLYARASRLIGGFKDVRGKSDLAMEHDRYLEQIYQ